MREPYSSLTPPCPCFFGLKSFSSVLCTHFEVIVSKLAIFFLSNVSWTTILVGDLQCLDLDASSTIGFLLVGVLGSSNPCAVVNQA
jgi:hypothetical protein